MTNDVLSAIAKRRSIRRYKDRQVDEETIARILRAGMAAPSANNRQPWEFVAITERKTLDLIAERHPYAKMLRHAPLCICVCGDLQRAGRRSTEFWIQDCSAATQNILLAAEALDLGAVWCGVHPNNDLVEMIRGVLSLPPHVTPLNVIAIGYPDDDPPVKDKWREDRVHWQTW